MKPAFILLSLLATALTWWWYAHMALRADAPDRPGPLRRLAHSLIAGVVVYFILMAIATIWLLTTT